MIKSSDASQLIERVPESEVAQGVKFKSLTCHIERDDGDSWIAIRGEVEFLKVPAEKYCCTMHLAYYDAKDDVLGTDWCPLGRPGLPFDYVDTTSSGVIENGREVAKVRLYFTKD